MKLGRDTGSVTNWIQSNGVKGQPTPVVGMGVTFLHWTDRSAGTIVGVQKIWGKVYITCQGDHAKRIDKNGMSESQEYEYSPNPDAPYSYFRQNKTGRWDAVFFKLSTKRWVKLSSPGLLIGHRNAYHDFSF